MSYDSNSPYNAANHEGQSADDVAAHAALTAAMQNALIAIATANSSAPTDGQAIIFEASTGNLIWGSGGGSTPSTAGQPFGLLLAITKAA